VPRRRVLEGLLRGLESGLEDGAVRLAATNAGWLAETIAMLRPVATALEDAATMKARPMNSGYSPAGSAASASETADDQQSPETEDEQRRGRTVHGALGYSARRVGARSAVRLDDDAVP
jgi:hypothetical protein